MRYFLAPHHSINKAFNTIYFPLRLKANVAKRDTEFQQLIEKNGKIRKKLAELLPEENLFEDTDHPSISEISENSPEPSISDCMEKMVDEIGKLKAYIGKLELQLYETDEKISDLMENVSEIGQLTISFILIVKICEIIPLNSWQKLELEKENATLKVENANMTTLAKLVTENMQESIDTSKKWVNAYTEDFPRGFLYTNRMYKKNFKQPAYSNWLRLYLENFYYLKITK